MLGTRQIELDHPHFASLGRLIDPPVFRAWNEWIAPIVHALYSCSEVQFGGRDIMPREPIPTWYFAVVAVRKENQYLLVHECRHGQNWYLPAGRIEPGETFVEAAEREAFEETGIPVEVDGLIRIEHTPFADSARIRVIFTAVPRDDRPPKSVPDEESLGAEWVRLDQLAAYPLRGRDVIDILEYLESNMPIYPLDLIQSEGRRYL